MFTDWSAPLSWSDFSEDETSIAVMRIMSSAVLVGASRRKFNEPPLMVRPAMLRVPVPVPLGAPGLRLPELRTTCPPMLPEPASVPPAMVTVPDPVAEPPTPTPVFAASRVPPVMVVPPM